MSLYRRFTSARSDTESDNRAYVSMHQRQQRDSTLWTGGMLTGHMHSTEIGREAHTESPEFSTVRSDFWPSAPLAQWPLALLDLYFAWLMVEWEGVEQ